MRHRFLFVCSLTILLALAPVVARSADSDGIVTILPGDARFKTPGFDDYEALYTSSSSKSGAFTLQVRRTGDGKSINMIDIIPMQESVIVAQRNIDFQTHRVESGAGPNFAWGGEYIVRNFGDKDYDWTRVPLRGGEPKRMMGEFQNGGAVSEMFSPTLASLMPMEVGTKFRMPAAYPRKGEFVSSELDEYQVLRKERLDLPSGLSCDCWVIEKKLWGNHYESKEMIWVSREAPFVFRRHRDVGGKRDFVSDLLAFRPLAR